MSRRHRLVRRTLIATCVASAAAVLAACGAGAPVPHHAATGGHDRALHDRLPEDVRAAGRLWVGTEASYPPASFFAPDGRTIVGFEPDLAAALGKVLGVRFTFRNVDFTDALPMVQDHRIDLAMSAMTDTLEREKQADFVNYFTAGTSIVVQRGNPKSISDLDSLCGKVVAVEKGTVQVDLLRRATKGCSGPGIDIRTYPTNSDALLQLRTGRAVAVPIDFPPAAHLADDPHTKAHYQLATTTQYEPGLYGIAVAKDRSQLRDVLRDALEWVMSAGTYAALLDTWGVGDSAIGSASVNSGRN